MINDKICFLIDDDEDDQEIFRLALKDVKEPISCITASNGIEALEKLRQEGFRPHYIFLDLNMPRMNGKQCLVEIRKIEHLKSTPVFMYSTSSDQVIMNQVKDLGATDYIIKPAGIGELTNILNRYMVSSG